jgi:hypothetical protein
VRPPAVVLTAAVLCLARPVPGATIDFLHVVAGVGGSTGGHYALRFGDDVYHYQNDDTHLLVPQRVDAEHFRWVYTVLENRTVEVARVEVSDDAYERLRDGFNARYLAFNRQRALLTALQRDREILEIMERRARDPSGAPDNRFTLPGANLFANRPGHDAAQSAALARLRERMRERYGPTFLSERLAALRRDIRGLRPLTVRDDEGTVAADRVPGSALRFSEQYEALALQHLALQALARGAPVAPEAVLTNGAADAPDALALTADERAHLTSFADRLEDRLTALPSSRRADWGFAFLVGMARLEAARRSAATGRLMLLDAYPAEASSVAAAAVRERAAFMAELEADARARFHAARARVLSNSEITERDFNQLEEAGNRFVELWRGVSRGFPVRVYAGTLTPGRQAAAPAAPLPELDADEIAATEAAARTAEEAYASALHDVAAYHLTQHNCVTEIFRVIEAILGRAGSIQALGGYIDPDSLLTVAPFMAHRAVIGTYAVAAAGEMPSYRLGQVAQMEQQEPAVAVYLREANTLTSTLYRPNDTDSFFLFFTDDAVLSRPLFGLANLAAGLGQALWGVAKSPFDRGRALRAGALGMAYSLPELFLVNVRKGTFEYGPEHVADIPPMLEPTAAD